MSKHQKNNPDLYNPIFTFTISQLQAKNLPVYGGALTIIGEFEGEKRLCRFFEPGVQVELHRVKLLESFRDPAIPHPVFITIKTDPQTARWLRDSMNSGAEFVITGIEGGVNWEHKTEDNPADAEELREYRRLFGPRLIIAESLMRGKDLNELLATLKQDEKDLQLLRHTVGQIERRMADCKAEITRRNTVEVICPACNKNGRLCWQSQPSSCDLCHGDGKISARLVPPSPKE
jgi:hypothetical protein